MQKNILKITITELVSIVSGLLAIMNYLGKFFRNVPKRNIDPKIANFLNKLCIILMTLAQLSSLAVSSIILALCIILKINIFVSILLSISVPLAVFIPFLQLLKGNKCVIEFFKK